MQGIENAAAQPHKAVLPDPHLFSDLVRCPETDPPDIVRQAVGVLPDNPDGVISVSLVYAGRMGRRHVMGLQEKHDIPDLFLGLPLGKNPGRPLFPDALNFAEAVRIGFDHFQRLVPESLDDPPGHLRPHPFDQAGTEVFLNPQRCGRERLFPFLR